MISGALFVFAHGQSQYYSCLHAAVANISWNISLCAAHYGLMHNYCGKLNMRMWSIFPCQFTAFLRLFALTRWSQLRMRTA